MLKRLKGYFLLATALIACPCHLPVTLAVLGGTGLGLFLTRNLLWVLAALLIYFVWALAKGLQMIRSL